ncbi:MAG: hypothetical protein JRN09_00735 [Nitrososphaerota archaeon]|nr:hypothetical protein [Nitrososphaerota archaeon]
MNVFKVEEIVRHRHDFLCPFLRGPIIEAIRLSRTSGFASPISRTCSLQWVNGSFGQKAVALRSAFGGFG